MTEVVGAPAPTPARPVHAVDRRHRILERVAAEQTIHVGELASELGVSEMTIRRDIRRLERDGFVRQTYGGATAHLTRSLDVAFNARALQHAREKRLIGMRAIDLVVGARMVFLGIGTTVEQFARYLPARTGLTVVTASLPIASLLGTRAVGVVALGGSVVRDELTCSGPIATATLARYRFDLAVIGAAGLSARWGITELTQEEAEVQRVAIDRSDRIVVLADGSKIGAATSVVVMPADRVATLVTDESAPADALAELRKLGITIITAGAADAAHHDAAGSHGRRRADTRSPAVAARRG
ncbi:MAG TPA: DeoR/GlpR family DNA-binding transcription regulator [Candidatus Limnocylindrales bacterium]|nr:DeoR/GlpR family DNA-binding transcription regulator [Candidatus Limnocylindrales bacterium]